MKHAFPKNSPMSQDSEPGMTLLDWFAGMALAGVINGWSASPANEAYEVALEMMKVREDAHRRLQRYSCGEDEEQGVVGSGAGTPEAGEEETGKEEKAGEKAAEK